jgi:threonine/homoserine/homoserine lactone efflux protein
MILIREAPLVFQVLTWLGAAYLIWLGWQGLTAKKSLIDQNENQISTLQISSAAMDGLAISLLNPKITAFFLALFSQFVDQATNLLNSSIIVATPMLIDGLWYSLIAIFVSQKFLLTKLRKHGVWFDRGIGVLLILIALRVFFNDPLI